jgi:predicted lipoprotein with Yx(FWY)xxD motif
VRHPLVLGAAALATAGLIAGCGSSSSSSSSSTAASTPSTATQSTAASSTASTSTTSATSTAGEQVSAKHGKLGTILAAGPKKLTVYLYEGDKGSASSCTGACAAAWPPVMTSGEPHAMAGAVAANLSTITRPDGTKQVTYNGHPLYFFARDKDSGDAYGQGVKAFGADWYVMKPSGVKIDAS